MKKRGNEVMIIKNRRKQSTSKKLSSTVGVLIDKDKSNYVCDPTQPNLTYPNQTQPIPTQPNLT